MKTLKEYLERNDYNIVKSLMELLSISEEEAKNFYKALTLFDESDVIDALKEPEDEEKLTFIKNLYSEFLQHKNGQEMTEDHQSQPENEEEFVAANDPKRFEIRSGVNGRYDIFDKKKKEVVSTVHSGHEAHNELFYYRARHRNDKDDAVEEAKDVSRLASKAAGGGYDMARELSKGQYQPKIVQNKKFKDTRQQDKSKLKRGIFESAMSPVIVNENNEYKFKLVESSTVATNENIEMVIESATMIAPLGGMSAVPGIGMNNLRKMSGIAVSSDEPIAGENLQDLDQSTEFESPDVNAVLAILDQMDELTKLCLMDILSNQEATKTVAMNAEQMQMVKCAISDFGCALQCWIEESCGALDFLSPLVDTLWVKYNEFCV